LIDGKNIAELSQMSISNLHDWLNDLPSRLTERQNVIAVEILKEINEASNLTFSHFRILLLRK